MYPRATAASAPFISVQPPASGRGSVRARVAVKPSLSGCELRSDVRVTTMRAIAKETKKKRKQNSIALFAIHFVAYMRVCMCVRARTRSK